MMTYVFIFRTNKYDLYFSIYLFLIFLHWLLLKNECILSYLEKKTINKDYILGSKPFEHPYRDMIPTQLTVITNIIKIYNIIIVILRNTKNYFIIISLLIFLIYIIYNYLVKYKII
jgi:hypothetical protein